MNTQNELQIICFSKCLRQVCGVCHRTYEIQRDRLGLLTILAQLDSGLFLGWSYIKLHPNTNTVEFNCRCGHTRAVLPATEVLLPAAKTETVSNYGSMPLPPLVSDFD
jgi:hypothetical protein